MPANSATVSVVAPAWSTPEQTAWAGALDLPTTTDPELVPEQYRPSTLAELVSTHAAATDVANWWAAADGSQRSALLASSPEALGNLEGIPYQVRDGANRSFLTATIARIESRIASGSVGRAASEDLQAQLHML
ncbi:MAG: hypothetical protein ABIQ01_10410, partial [Pseudolysinimonas sp.]